MPVIGGYEHFNSNANLGLKSWMTGTTMAWYTMPGWEVNYLWGKGGVGEMNPIALGDKYYSYILCGEKQSEIIKFLDTKKDQVVKLAKRGFGSSPEDWAHAYSGVDVQTEARFTTMTAAWAEVAAPPTTVLREGILQVGGGLLGAGAEGAFSSFLDLFGLVDGVGGFLGLSPTERLWQASANNRPKVMLMINLGSGGNPAGLNWVDVPLMNGKTSFGIIKDRLKGAAVKTYNPAALLNTVKKSAKKSGTWASLKQDLRTLGRFI